MNEAERYKTITDEQLKQLHQSADYKEALRRADEEAAEPGFPGASLDADALRTRIAELETQRETYLMNPDAVGDPGATPVVRVGPGLLRLLRPCGCGGVNGFHGDGCTQRQAPLAAPVEHQDGTDG